MIGKNLKHYAIESLLGAADTQPPTKMCTFLEQSFYLEA